MFKKNADLAEVGSPKDTQGYRNGLAFFFKLLGTYRLGATGWEIETMKNYEDLVKSVSMRESWGIRWCSRVILGTKEAITGSAAGHPGISQPSENHKT